jgi:hypothetical protein
MKKFTIFAKTLLLASLLSIFAFNNAYADYCMNGSNSCSFEYMDNVEFGDIDNDSDCSTSVQDFTNLSTDLNVGEEETMTVSIEDY